MIKLIELPKSYEIRNIIDKYDLRWFSSDGYTHIFHHEVIQSQRLSPLSFKVKLRTYEVNDISLSDLLRPETIMVSGYQLECEIIYNEVNSKWGVNSGIDDQELVPLEIQSFPDSERIIVELINRVGDDLIDQSKPEDLMRVDITQIHSSLRKLLSNRSND